MKKRNLAALCLAIVLVVCASVRSAIAYFTTYAEARGGYPIYMGGTDIEEEFYDWTKHVVITSSEDAQPVYVRALALAGSEYELSYSGEGWRRGADGYYYYDSILNAGEQTKELLVEIKNMPEDPKENDSFNVIVVYETLPVQFNEDGEPYPADWSMGGGRG